MHLILRFSIKVRPLPQQKLKGNVCLRAIDVNDLILGQPSSTLSKSRQPFHPWQASFHLRRVALFVSVLCHLFYEGIQQSEKINLTSGWMETLFTLARLLQLRMVSVAFQDGPAEKVPGDFVRFPNPLASGSDIHGSWGT